MSHLELATIPRNQEQDAGDPVLRTRVRDAIQSLEVSQETKTVLLTELLSRPAELLIAESHELLATYQHRAVTYTDGEATVTRFATRHEDEGGMTSIDDDYCVIEDPDGNLHYYVRIMPSQNLGYSFAISPVETATGEQGHQIRLSVVSGTYEVPIRQDGEGQFEDALVEILDRTIKTARIVSRRAKDNPIKAIEADGDGKRLLLERIEARM